MAGRGAEAESSDDDIEVVPNSVDNYWLEDAGETPVSFAELPFFKTGDAKLPNKLVYVRGVQDNGTRLYMRAVEWNLEFTKAMKPDFLLKTEKYWIKLKKPRKSFETTIRSIISTATFLNYAFMNPSDTEKAAWNYVKNAYKSWEIAPCRDDLASHLLVIKHLVVSNECLASSMALQTILAGVSKKRLASVRERAQQSSDLQQYKLEKETSADRKESDKDGKELGPDEGGDLAEGESICCICDDGGDMICCDGPCMRSFHFKDAACGHSTLGLSKSEADQMDKFFCPNCKFKRHQCFVCGDLGCSDEAAGAACEVFMCGVDRCRHFYHPRCVAELLLKDRDISKQVAMAESIKEGKRFVCPAHKCWKCGQVEVKEAKNLQFGTCRRCPRVWHRQCLPSSLLHSDPKRFWPGLLPNKILVYCNRHAIIPELATPARNHVKFPEGSAPAARKRFVKGKTEEEVKKSKLSRIGQLRKKFATSLKNPGGHTAVKSLETKKKPVSLVKQTKPGGHEPTKSKPSQSVTARDPLPGAYLKSESIPARTHVGISAKQQNIPAKTHVGVSAKQDMLSQKIEQKCTSQSEGMSNLDARLARTDGVSAEKLATPSTSASHSLLQTRTAPLCKTSSAEKEGERTVDDIIEGANTSISIESVLKKHEALVNNTEDSKSQDIKHFVEKLEEIVKGMGKAVETLENGGSVEDAKLHCPQAYIRYMKSCSKDLELYLAPLLYDSSDAGGVTKQGKLKVIVDRLHWYVEKYDTVMGVTSGLDNFPSLLKKKLEESAKVCVFRNFDLSQTGNANFSKENWFAVKPNESPDGDGLVIRLNVPKGLKADQFVDHALAFRPKLIVLTVPKGIDLKCGLYDLVWADSNFWEGHTSSSPGPIKGQEDSSSGCDNAPSILHFWSRPDWTLKCKQIALDQGHILSLTSSDFAGSALKVSSPDPPSHSDFDMKLNHDNRAVVKFRREEEMVELGKSKHNRSQGGLERSVGGKEGSGDSDKRKSIMLQGKDTIMREPTSGRGTASTLDTSIASKLDQIMRRRVAIKSHVSEYDAQPSDNSSKSKVETSTSSKNDSSVPPKKRVILKRKGEDVSDVEPSGSQSNNHGSSQWSAEKEGSSLKHGVSRKEWKTDDNHLFGGDKKVLELVPDKPTSEKYLANNEMDLRGKRSSEEQSICELGGRKLLDKYGLSRQGEARAAAPARDRLILKRKGEDVLDMEPSGSQSNNHGSSQWSAEKESGSSKHGDSRKERKTDDSHICGDDEKVLELVHDKLTSEKYVANNEADLMGQRSSEKQSICELGGRKLPDKHGLSRQGEARAALPARDPGKKVMSKNVKSEDCVSLELPKRFSRNDDATPDKLVKRDGIVTQDELEKRTIWHPGTPSAQMAQQRDPVMRSNVQMPATSHGAASATHPGVHLPLSQRGMQSTCPSNQYGRGHPYGSSGAGRAHILPGGQLSPQYFAPGTYTPSSPAPIYSPSHPVYLPPGYGSGHFQHFGPLPVQQYGPLAIQPQRPPFPERPPNQRNTGSTCGCMNKAGSEATFNKMMPEMSLLDEDNGLLPFLGHPAAAPLD